MGKIEKRELLDDVNSRFRYGLAIQRERYPERKHARDAVYRAVKEGRLIKPDRCEDCGATGRIEGHHHSYEPEHWLDVKWVCKRCHNKRDKQDLTS